MAGAYPHFLHTPNGLIPVADLDAALNFYRGRLGFSLINREADFAMLSRGDVTIRLALADHPAKAKNTHCLFVVKNIEALYQAYQENGVLPAETKLQTYSNGQRQFALSDPSGASLRFLEYPEFP